MKGTSVVQGLKSLAAKIHPQLPLNARESNKLLTALTSSFRKHLDEAHPTAARPSSEDGNDTTSKHGGVIRSQSHAIHSSAAYADRHLATVLTNPLLAKGGQRVDYASAKRELIENPAKDPIQLLEEYHEKNAATIRIAELCLQKFKDDLANMSAENRKAYIAKSEPGRRVFLWLLQGKVYDVADYNDNLRFQYLLIYFLVEEGREENVWDWIRIDMTIANDHPCTNPSGSKRTLHAYRWRGRLLCALLEIKLGYGASNTQENVPDDHLHQALDAFSKACDLRLLGRQRQDHLRWIPFGGAAAVLKRQLTCFRRLSMDVQRYETFQKTLVLSMEGVPAFYILADNATLDLSHPRHPSAGRALQFWQELLSESPSDSARTFLSRLRNSPGSAETQQWFRTFTTTVHVLRNEGRPEEASWLIENVLPLFPGQSPYVQAQLDEIREHDNQDTARQRDVESNVRVPFPTFA